MGTKRREIDRSGAEAEYEDDRAERAEKPPPASRLSHLKCHKIDDGGYESCHSQAKPQPPPSRAQAANLTLHQIQMPLVGWLVSVPGKKDEGRVMR